MKYRVFSLFAILFFVVSAMAQQADYSKLSGFVRRALADHRSEMRRAPKVDNRQLCALVRTQGNDTSPLTNNGCRVLASFGSIHVASFPMSNIASLSRNPDIKRIEAGAPHHIDMDTANIVTMAIKAHAGVAMPQAFTGKGVVVGVQDIGFDLTHPNFYDTGMNASRIKCLWDQISADTLTSDLYVGADYHTPEELQAYAHSRDGLIQTHGTHTLGSAAGSGYDTPYKGIAYDSDICLVSNAVSSDLVFIDSTDVYKYTYATDILGFKYIFDYAESRGMPCVVSFSEGSSEDFRGDDVLFYSSLESLVGPGRIFVASAGNDGQDENYIRKPENVPSLGVTLRTSASTGGITVKSGGNFDLVLKVYDSADGHLDYVLSPTDILSLEDSLLTDTIEYDSLPYYITALAYPSCYDETETVLEVYVKTESRLGITRKVMFEMRGENAVVECFRTAGNIISSDKSYASNAYSIHSPASAPSAICVGATGYRTGFVNYLGDYVEYDKGTNGRLSEYSSVGPTYDGRIKPDVVAPGTNVISSYSSFYLENNPWANDIKADVEHFDFNGRTYAWNCNSGTSMSTPVVAGCIALWLQAKPDLTKDDIMGLFERTCRHYDESLTYPNNNYGYGEINVYLGLLDILGIDAIESVSKYMPRSVDFSLSNDAMLRLSFSKPLCHEATIRIFSTSGCEMLSNRIASSVGEATVSLATLPKGVYAVQVNCVDEGVTGSTLIRR